MTKDFLGLITDRLLDLLQEDDEIRQALIRLINGKAAHEEALAERARR